MDVSERTWARKREKLAESFDLQCYRVACALLALQQRELALMRERPPGSVDQLEMSRMTKSIRDIQAMGRLSIGETTESRQTEFDFVVRYEQTANPPVHA